MKPRTDPARIAWVLVALTGCATYRPAPVDPVRILEELETVEWSTPGTTGAGGPDGASGPRELSAFAVSHDPRLAAVRAQVGVRRALLVEAGLLPDPELGWDAMDILAAQIVDGSSSSVDALSGLGLMFPLPRPGERGARVGVAEWNAEEAWRRVIAAEWSLTRDVHVAYEEVLAAELLLDRTRALTELAESTNAYFERARDAGAATAIQANLALGQLQAMRLDVVRAETRVEQARQALNALLGLPPGAELTLGAGVDPAENEALRATTAELTAHAVASRPDLAALRARYRAAEEGVRFVVSKQFPQIAVGTGIRLTLPIFSRFGRPELATAMARREQVGRELTAAVHGARREIAAAHTRWQLAERELELVENGLLPNAERNLELSREAFRAGEVTLLETLALQRALVEARTRHAEVRAECSKRAWSLLAASGWLLGASPINDANDAEDSR